MKPLLIRLSAALFFSGLLVSTASYAEDSCKDVLVYAARNYMSRYSLEDRKAWVFSQKCGASTRSSSAGIDMLVEAVPVGVTLSDQSQRQWCEDNRRLDAYRSIADAIDSTVSVPAVQNWASCMEAYSRNLITRVRITPDEETIHLLLTNKTANPEQLTDVFAHSREQAGLVCSPMPSAAQPAQLPMNREVLINCTRSPVDVIRRGETYKVLPAGSVTAVTTLSSYLYSFPERFIDEVVPNATPQRQAMSLNGMHVGTKAYWAGATQSQLIPCSRLEPPAPNFELIEISFREERVKGIGTRGLCGKPPYCDSAGEFCNEVYYKEACFINREWHDWYKAQGVANQIPYSKESVCGT